jgi:hypothetical protein
MDDTKNSLKKTGEAVKKPQKAKKILILEEFIKTEESFNQNIDNFIKSNKDTLDKLIKFRFPHFPLLLPHQNKECNTIRAEWAHIIKLFKLINTSNLKVFEEIKNDVTTKNTGDPNIDDKIFEAQLTHLTSEEYKTTIQLKIRQMGMIAAAYDKKLHAFTEKYCDITEFNLTKLIDKNIDGKKSKKEMGAIRYNLSSLFIQPVQRFPRYCLLSGELLKSLSKDDPQSAPLEAFLNMTKIEADKNNSSVGLTPDQEILKQSATIRESDAGKNLLSTLHNVLRYSDYFLQTVPAQNIKKHTHFSSPNEKKIIESISAICMGIYFNFATYSLAMIPNSFTIENVKRMLQIKLEELNIKDASGFAIQYYNSIQRLLELNQNSPYSKRIYLKGQLHYLDENITQSEFTTLTEVEKNNPQLKDIEFFQELKNNNKNISKKNYPNPTAKENFPEENNPTIAETIKTAQVKPLNNDNDTLNNNINNQMKIITGQKVIIPTQIQSIKLEVQQLENKSDETFEKRNSPNVSIDGATPESTENINKPLRPKSILNKSEENEKKKNSAIEETILYNADKYMANHLNAKIFEIFAQYNNANGRFRFFKNMWKPEFIYHLETQLSSFDPSGMDEFDIWKWHVLTIKQALERANKLPYTLISGDLKIALERCITYLDFIAPNNMIVSADRNNVTPIPLSSANDILSLKFSYNTPPSDSPENPATLKIKEENQTSTSLLANVLRIYDYYCSTQLGINEIVLEENIVKNSKDGWKSELHELKCKLLQLYFGYLNKTENFPTTEEELKKKMLKKIRICISTIRDKASSRSRLSNHLAILHNCYKDDSTKAISHSTKVGTLPAKVIQSQLSNEMAERYINKHNLNSVRNIFQSYSNQVESRWFSSTNPTKNKKSLAINSALYDLNEDLMDSPKDFMPKIWNVFMEKLKTGNISGEAINMFYEEKSFGKAFEMVKKYINIIAKFIDTDYARRPGIN